MHKYLTILYSATLLVACSTAEDPIIPSPNPGDGLVEIAFASSDAGQESSTRADVIKTSPLAQNFVVFGYKSMTDQTRQTVFENVPVIYNTEEKNYYYEHTRYWDTNAIEYRFFGYSSTQVTPTVTDESTLTIDAPISQVEDFYYSGNVKVDPENYRKTVKLIFKKLYTNVEIKFFTSSLLSNGPEDVIKLSDIIFAPDPESGDMISVEGQIKIDYPLVGDPNELVTWPAGTLSEMKFNNVILTESNCGKENAQTAIPMTETGTTPSVYTIYPTIKDTTPFVLSLKVNGGDIKTKVPATTIGWKANHKYTYLFKISVNRIELYDVQIDPWMFGGSQEEEWKNW